MGFKGVMKRWLEEGLQDVMDGSADPSVPHQSWVSPLPLLWGWNSLNKVCGSLFLFLFFRDGFSVVFGSLWITFADKQVLSFNGEDTFDFCSHLFYCRVSRKKKSQICGRIHVSCDKPWGPLVSPWFSEDPLSYLRADFIVNGKRKGN